MLAQQSFIMWLIIGAFAGWLAGKLVHGYGFGLIGNIVVGILGAVVGGYILPQLGFIPVSAWGDFVAAVLGAVILLVGIGLVRRLT
jgi:uncharacterized membrane protein YeaQ/YmgE (transglycosylase-associated protein family)